MNLCQRVDGQVYTIWQYKNVWNKCFPIEICVQEKQKKKRKFSNFKKFKLIIWNEKIYSKQYESNNFWVFGNEERLPLEIKLLTYSHYRIGFEISLTLNDSIQQMTEVDCT